MSKVIVTLLPSIVLAFIAGLFFRTAPAESTAPSIAPPTPPATRNIEPEPDMPNPDEQVLRATVKLVIGDYLAPTLGAIIDQAPNGDLFILTSWPPFQNADRCDAVLWPFTGLGYPIGIEHIEQIDGGLAVLRIQYRGKPPGILPFADKADFSTGNRVCVIASDKDTFERKSHKVTDADPTSVYIENGWEVTRGGPVTNHIGELIGVMEERRFHSLKQIRGFFDRGGFALPSWLETKIMPATVKIVAVDQEPHALGTIIADMSSDFHGDGLVRFDPPKKIPGKVILSSSRIQLPRANLRVQYWPYDSTPYVAEMLAMHPERDLVLLWAPCADHRPTVMPVTAEPRLTNGRQVISVEMESFKDPAILPQRFLRHEPLGYKTTVTASSASLGGPLCNSRGELIGVNRNLNVEHGCFEPLDSLHVLLEKAKLTDLIPLNR